MSGSAGACGSGGLLTGPVCVRREPSCGGARGNLGAPGFPPDLTLRCHFGGCFTSGDFSFDVVLDPDLKNDS